VGEPFHRASDGRPLVVPRGMRIGSEGAEVAEVEIEPVVVAKPEEPPSTVIPMPNAVRPAVNYRQDLARRRGDGRQMSLF
jgi:hypothetical protein